MCTTLRYIIITAFVGWIATPSLGQSCDIEGMLYADFADVRVVFDENNCNTCHAGNNTQGEWSYKSYDDLLKSGDCNKPLIVHGNASASYLYSRLSGAENICGESNSQHIIPSEQLDLIETWINNGAPEYCMPLYPEIKLTLNEAGCQSCHGSVAPQSWSYQDYEGMISNGTDDNCNMVSNVIFGNASESLLYDIINNDGELACGGQIQEHQVLSDEKVAMVRDWINGGAPRAASLLPVILSYFEVNEDQGSVNLEWSTEVEIGTDKFVIERSQSGRNFVQIGEIDASGSANIGDTYTFKDQEPVLGENYYRLRILDLDGSYDYSNIRLIRVKSGEASLAVSPNPARSFERLRVKWNPPPGQVQAYLNLVDVNGQNLTRKIIFEGTNYVRLPSLLEGVYYVIVEDYFEGFLLERIVIID